MAQSKVLDQTAFNKDSLDVAMKAAAHLPSPLRTGIVVGALGALVGVLLDKSPVKWGLVTGGITFGATFAADTVFSLGLGMGAASCVDVTKQVFAAKGLAPGGYATSGWDLFHDVFGTRDPFNAHHDARWEHEHRAEEERQRERERIERERAEHHHFAGWSPWDRRLEDRRWDEHRHPWEVERHPHEFLAGWEDPRQFGFDPHRGYAFEPHHDFGRPFEEHRRY